MAKKLAPIFLTPPPRPSSVATSTFKTRIIKPICDPSSNYHTVTENTVKVNGKDATNWVCNSAGCEVNISSERDAELHVRSTVDTPDLTTLLSIAATKEQVQYLLKYPNWYILYGKEKKVQQMLKKLVPRLFPEIQERKVCFKPWFAFNLKTGLGGCMPCHAFLNRKATQSKSTRSQMSELKTEFGKLRTVSKHERYRGTDNATHALAFRKFFPEDSSEEKVEKADAEVPKKALRSTTIPEHVIFKRLRNLFEQILLFCTGFVSIVFAAKSLRMSRNHGGEYPDMLDSETFIRNGYIKAGALVRHNLFIQIEPQDNPIQKIYTLTSLQDGHHAGSTKLMLFNESF